MIHAVGYAEFICKKGLPKDHEILRLGFELRLSGLEDCLLRCRRHHRQPRAELSGWIERG